MQLTPRYLVKTKTNIVLDQAGHPVEYRPVYTKTLKVYKNIDNVLQFTLLNADQKTVELPGDAVFVAFDQNNRLVLEVIGESLENDSNIRTRGLFSVTLASHDLINIPHQYLHYNIYFKTSAGKDLITYAGADLTTSGIIYLDGQAYPSPREPVVLDQFQTQNNQWVVTTESNTSPVRLGGSSAGNLNTVFFHTNSYTGTVEIQVTLGEPNTVTGWSRLQTVTFTGAETEPTSVNIYGVFNNVRFVLSADPKPLGAVQFEKIVIR
jgi:hypothetical protein